MHSEYARQREHLERSVASLRKKLAKDSEIHRTDTIRVMQVGYRGDCIHTYSIVRNIENLVIFCPKKQHDKNLPLQEFLKFGGEMHAYTL